ncbi:hypothetical protein EPO15_14185 [bacterium]|nr:MAG: hypothetical protein EPO15_14185 [bacterium]
MRHIGALLTVCAAAATLLAAAAPAGAADSAALQFTVPAPDPVQAGETVALQALAVNTGQAAWNAGSYYWVGEVYNLDERLVGRTEPVTPPEAVQPGAVASISLPFRVPDTDVGRRLYRVLLVKDSQTLVRSALKPFVIVEKVAPEAPKQVDYRVEGNVTVSYRNSSRDEWNHHSGATTVNAVGKIKDSSYLFNSYILHQKGRVFDPFTILFTFYAPWGTVYGGDISPTLSELSVNSHGARGAMLEQRKGDWDWTVVGGMTVDSQAGTATTDGRYARSLYGFKVGRRFFTTVTTGFNYFLSADESQSLSTDPRSANFRGPTLVPQKNSGKGLSLAWEPKPKLKFSLDYQQNMYVANTAKPGANDTAWRGEFRWDRTMFKLKTYLQRAGPNFVSFGAPSVVGDRMTTDVTLGLFFVTWNSLNLAVNQYKDNLKNNPLKTTTQQRYISVSDSLQLKTGTNVNLSGSLTTAKGQPSTVLDNQTTTMGLGVSQPIGRHSLSLNLQMSKFKDKNKLAHDLDSDTASLSSTWALPRQMGAAFGVSRSQSKDKVDGSARSSLSVSPSFSMRLGKLWAGQYWGTLTNTKNTSRTFPSDTQSVQLNTEFTRTLAPTMSGTLGAGYNSTKDKYAPGNAVKEILVTSRFSWSF